MKHFGSLKFRYTICIFVLVILLAITGYAESKPNLKFNDMIPTENNEINLKTQNLEFAEIPEYAVRLLISLETTSDWTEVLLESGEHWIELNKTIHNGSQINELNTYISSTNLNAISGVLNETIITVDYELAVIGLIDGSTFKIELTKGNIGYLQVNILNYNTEIPNLVSSNTYLRNYTDTRNAYNIVIDDNLLLSPEPFINFVDTQPDNFEILAFYYSWYGNPYFGTYWDHWDEGGNNPYLTDNEGKRQIGATNYPQLGAYDSQDPSIIQTHIRMAKTAGIDAFISTWWGINDFTDTSFGVILDTAELMNFTSTIYFETGIYWDWDRDEAQQGILESLRYIYDTYADHPGMYRTQFNDGPVLPMIYFYVVSAWDVDFWAYIFDQLDAENRNMYYSGDSGETIYANVFDELHDYMPYFQPNIREYVENNALGMQIKQIISGQEKRYSPTVVPAFDATGIGSNAGIVPRLNGQTYENAWEIALSVHPKTVLITSFNEWHEGTELEFSMEYGPNYLMRTDYWRHQADPSYVTQGNISIMAVFLEATIMLDRSIIFESFSQTIVDEVNLLINNGYVQYDLENYALALSFAFDAINLMQSQPGPTISRTSSTTSATSVDTITTATSTINPSSNSATSPVYINPITFFVTLTMIRKINKKIN